MRNLIVLFASSLVISAAGANEPPAAKHAEAVKPAAAAAAASSASAEAKAPSIKPSIKPVLGKPAVAEKSVKSEKADKAKEEEAELDLSERIAVRLAEMRATQAARAANAAKARKVADARKREAEIVAATPPPPITSSIMAMILMESLTVYITDSIERHGLNQK